MPFISAAIAGISAFFASVGTFIATVSATTIGAFLIDTLSYIATNLLVQAIIGSPKPPPFSLRTTLRAGEETPRSFILGKTMTAGSLVYANTYTGGSSTPNAWMTQVIAVSDLPVKGLSQVFVNSEAVTLGSLDADKGYAVNGYNNKLYVKFYDGTQTAADSYLVAQLGSDTYRPYGSDRIGYGVAYVIIHAQIDQNLFAGFPQFRFLIDGIKLYDPTGDDTAGGAGSQRWATPSTWGGDGDYLPAVQAYNIMRGISYSGTWLYGLQGISGFQLPNAAWRDEIDKCRATVTENTGQVATYRGSVELEVDQEVGRTLEGIMTACAGRISEAGGVFKPLVGPVGSSVKSFTDDDILATAEQSFTPFPNLSDTVNGVTAQYPEPEEAYSLKTAPPLYDADMETQDGGYRLLSRVTLPNVPYREQVQRLMKWALAEARKQRHHTLVMPPDWYVIEPNDCVTWSSARNGYSNKLFRVDGVVILASGDVIIDIRETDPADYSWNTGTDFTQVNTSPVVTVRPPSQSVIGFGVQAVAIQDSASTTKRVGLKLSWSTTGVDDVEGLRFEVRRQDTQEVVSRPETMNFSSGELVTETGLVANVTYEVRAIYTVYSGRTVGWTSWVAVTTSLTITQPGVPVLTEQLYATRDGASVKVLINVDWSPSAEAKSYQIEARLAIDSNGNSTGEAFVTYGRTDQTEFNIRDIATGTWEVRVKGYNEQGVQSSYATASLAVNGLSTPPVQLQNLRIQKAGGLALLKWDKSTDLDVVIGGRVLIRHSASATPSWANSVSMDSVDGNTSIAAVPLRPGTYLIRPVDLTGVMGDVSSINTKGVQAVAFTNAHTFTAETAWSGTKTHTVVDGVNLKIDGVGELVTAPNDLSDSSWVKTGVTITVNTDTTPGGGAADTMTEDTSTGQHTILGQYDVKSGFQYKFKAVIKSNGTTKFRIDFQDSSFGGTTDTHATFNLSDGTVAGGGGLDLEEIIDLGGGWYECSGYATASTDDASANVWIRLSDGTNYSYTGGGSNGLIVGELSMKAVANIEGQYLFATAFDNLTVAAFRVRPDIDVSALNLGSTIDDRTSLIDTWVDFDDTEGAEIDVIVEMRHTDDDPAGSPTWSAWAQLDATEEEFRGAEFRARLITTSSDFNVLLAGLSVYIDEVV